MSKIESMPNEGAMMCEKLYIEHTADTAVITIDDSADGVNIVSAKRVLSIVTRHD